MEINISWHIHSKEKSSSTNDDEGDIFIHMKRWPEDLVERKKRE